MIPARLYPGFISIYGIPSQTGIEVNNGKGYQFGAVDQLLSGGSGTVSIGQSVLFDLRDGIPIIYQAQPYFLLHESKIILIEEPTSPP